MSNVREISIRGGRFSMRAMYGACIGSGYGAALGQSSVEQIVIYNGTFNAISSRGAGIGAGYAYAGNSTIGLLHIHGGGFDSL
jgi:hypothetical protein